MESVNLIEFSQKINRIIKDWINVPKSKNTLKTKTANAIKTERFCEYFSLTLFIYKLNIILWFFTWISTSLIDKRRKNTICKYDYAHVWL